MKKATILILIIFIFAQPSAQAIEEKMVEKAYEINHSWVENARLGEHNKADIGNIKNRISALKKYAKAYTPKGYNWRRLWKDAFAIVWQESHFVNYANQDDGTGFGWAAIQWDTAEDLAQRRGWNWTTEKHQILISDNQGSKVQAKYMIGYLVWLYEYYGQNRRQALSGYNKGLSTNWQRCKYFKAIEKKIHKLDEYLMEG